MFVYQIGSSINVMMEGGEPAPLDKEADTVFGLDNFIYPGEDDSFAPFGTPTAIIEKIAGEEVQNEAYHPEPEPATVVSIAWTTPPTKVTYSVGDALDLTGAVITATMSDETTEVVTNSCTFSPASGATLAATDVKVTATYESKTAEQSITVS